MLGSKNSFSFRLGLSFSSIVSGETHIMELLCMSSFTKTSVHTCVDRGHSGKGTKFWLQFLRKISAANRHVCIAGVSKDISVPVNWILNNGGPLLIAREQAVAHGLETLYVLCEMVIKLEQQHLVAHRHAIDVSDASLQCWQRHATTLNCNAHDKRVCCATVAWLRQCLATTDAAPAKHVELQWCLMMAQFTRYGFASMQLTQ